MSAKVPTMIAGSHLATANASRASASGSTLSSRFDDLTVRAVVAATSEGSSKMRLLLRAAVRQAAGLTGAVRAMALRDFGPGAA
jgi:hypothetical protein